MDGGARRWVLPVAALALAVGGGAHALPRPAARPVACGEVVTADVRLAADLRCAGPTGLVVAADGVEVDLDGHEVAGPGAGRTPGGARGITVRARGVRVLDGRVSGWDEGVRVEAGAGADLREVRLERHGTGAVVEGALRVSGSLLRGNTTGASARGPLVLDRSTVQENLTGVSAEPARPGGPGGPGAAAGDVVLRGSVLVRNGTALLCRGARVHVQRSAFGGNGAAITTGGCAPWTVRDSAFVRNGDHLWLAERGPDRVTVVCTLFSEPAGPRALPVLPC